MFCYFISLLRLGTDFFFLNKKLVTKGKLAYLTYTLKARVFIFYFLWYAPSFFSPSHFVPSFSFKFCPFLRSFYFISIFLLFLYIFFNFTHLIFYFFFFFNFAPFFHFISFQFCFFLFITKQSLRVKLRRHSNVFIYTPSMKI